MTGCSTDLGTCPELPTTATLGTPVKSSEILPTPTAPAPAETRNLDSQGYVVITETITTNAERYTIDVAELNRLELNQELPLVIDSQKYGRINLVVKRTTIGSKGQSNVEALSIFQVYLQGDEFHPLVALTTYADGNFGLPSQYTDNILNFGNEFRLNFDRPENPITHQLSSEFNIYVMSRSTRGTTIIEP